MADKQTRRRSVERSGQALKWTGSCDIDEEMPELMVIL